MFSKHIIKIIHLLLLLLLLNCSLHRTNIIMVLDLCTPQIQQLLLLVLLLIFLELLIQLVILQTVPSRLERHVHLTHEICYFLFLLFLITLTLSLISFTILISVYEKVITSIIKVYICIYIPYEVTTT